MPDSMVDTAIPPAPDATEPADALADLLTEPPTDLTDDDRAAIVALDRMKRAKAMHKAAADALGRDIEREQLRLIELGVELGLVDNRGRLALGSVEDGQGFTVTPFEKRTIWPRYREDPATDQPYSRDQLLAALRDIGRDDLIVETTDQYGWPGYVRDRVKAWRKRTGQSGITDSLGRFVDHDGEVLTQEEALDPVADILALPRKLRQIVEPSDKIELGFTRRQIISTAVAESDAAQVAATDGAG